MIKNMDPHNQTWREAIAVLLSETFPEAYGDLNDALEEVTEMCEDNVITLIYLKDTALVGVVGARPAYGKTGWELHPLAVKKAFRNLGIGRALVKTLEEQVAQQGGIIIFLGSDDEHDRTSLSQTDLFINPFDKIRAIKNINNHPYSFYEKQGYMIVGVIPDANGFNKPDIMMAKRLVERPQK